MCTHQRWIYNRYSMRKVLVKCGKCDACMQEKANRSATRIRNHSNQGTIALFFTLTYSNDYVPYIRKSDFGGFDGSSMIDITVYRDYDFRREGGRGNLGLVRDKCGFLDKFSCLDYSVRDVLSCQSLNGKSRDCVGVCYYKDIQDFFKRLRQILKRKYNYEKSFSYWSCSEYGGISKRPHFHGLLYCQPSDSETLRDAICEAWPYADKSRTRQFCEIAKDAASYVASYVNCGISLSPFLQTDLFKQKHSSSKHFGLGLRCFSLSEILSKIDRGDLHYYSEQKFDGVSSVNKLSIPTYVLNRWFPKHKGFGWIPEYQLFELLVNPSKVYEKLFKSQGKINYKGIVIPYETTSIVANPFYCYTRQDCHRICTSLENAYDRFRLETGLSRDVYAVYYVKAWRLHNMSVLRDQYDNVGSFKDFEDFYTNIAEYEEDSIPSPTLAGLHLNRNPNTLTNVVMSSNNLTVLYRKKDKSKKVSNHVMVELGYDV